jgi:hypothetical protein
MTDILTELYEKALSIGAIQLCNTILSCADRAGITIKYNHRNMIVRLPSLKVLVEEIQFLTNTLLEYYPDALEHYEGNENSGNNVLPLPCHSCEYIHNEAHIWCALYPSGYPEQGCLDYSYDPTGLRRLKSKLKVEKMKSDYAKIEKQQQLALYRDRLLQYQKYSQGLKTEYKNLVNKPGYEDYLNNLKTAISDSEESISETLEKISKLESELELD